MRPARYFLRAAGTELAVYRWGEAAPGRPAALLAHGTGFCGPVWQRVAETLATEFVVYAIDRRGHGASDKPTDAYHFADFAEDTVGVIDALELDGAYGVGHSAGATDLLLASVERRHAFRCIFAMEPTAMNTTAPRQDSALEQVLDGQLGRSALRRATFESFARVLERYGSRPAFQSWPADLLEEYVLNGFEERPDGSVTLRCTPEIERSMLVHIFQAMAGTYLGDGRGNPFEKLVEIPCPTRIATTERSWEIYKQMARAAQEQIPKATSHHFDGSGHNVAQEMPEAVVLALRRFWSECAT